MLVFNMKVIQEPKDATRTILNPKFAGPVMSGGGNITYKCGSCESILLKDVKYKSAEDMVIKCAQCGSYNEIPTSHHTH
jgi:DNA-directed RNA polymerase subunit RPC12/RpoP